MEEENANKNKIKKKIIKTIIKKILIPAMILILIAAMAWGIISGIFEGISNVVKSIGNLFTPSVEDINYDFSVDGITIQDEQIEQIIKVIQDEGLTLADLGLSGDIDNTQEYDSETNKKESEKYLMQFLLAQLCTEYPDFGITESENHYNGIVKIKRATENSDGTNLTDMKYVRKDIFDNIISSINNNDKDDMNLGSYQSYTIEQLVEAIKSLYTIDNGGNLYFASWTQTVNSAGTKVTFSTKSVNYKSTVEKYGMPMQVPLALCLITQNPEYVYQFIENYVLTGEIVIAIQDTQKVDTYETWNDWNIQVHTKVEKILNSETNTTVTNERELVSETDRDDAHLKQYYSKTVVTTVERVAQIISVDTWMTKENVSYTNTQGQVRYPLGQETVVHQNVPCPEQIPTAQVSSSKDANGDTLITSEEYTLTSSTMTEIENIIYNEWQRGTISIDKDAMEQKAKNIIAQWNQKFRIPNTNKSEAAGPKIESGSDMLFELLNGTNTQRQLQIYKYLLYLYTNKNYGVTELETSIYEDIELRENINSTDIIVDVTKSNSNIVLTKEQIKQAIETTYSGKQETNLLQALDAFYEIQQNNKVNAVFAIAVAVQESSAGTNWDLIDPSTYNWMSVTAKTGYTDRRGTTWAKYSSFSDATRAFGNLVSTSSYYFAGGNYTVQTIGASYCNPPDAWVDAIIKQMKKIYSSININIGTYGEIGEGSAADGYASVYTSSSGYVYKEYKQGWGPWASSSYANGTMASKGCCPTAVAIVDSAKNSSVTPETIRQTSTGGLIVPVSAVKTYWSYANRTKSFSQDSIRSWLGTGNPVIVHVDSSSSYAHTEHWMALLDINGDQVYLSNPNGSGENGWVNISKVMVGLIEVMFIQ